MTKRLLQLATVSLFAAAFAGCSGGASGGAGALIPSAISNSRTAASTTTQAVPAHVQTGEYLWSSTELSTNPSTYAPYLTWAYVKPSLAASVKATGIKVIVYTNPLMPHGTQYDKTLMDQSYPGVRAQTCTGSLVTSWSGSGYLTDVRNSSAAAYVKADEDYYVNAMISANPGSSRPYDAVYVDNANSFYGLSALPCNYSDSTWTAGMDNALAASGYPTIVNTLSTSESSVPNKVAGLKASNIVGGEYEECFNDRHWFSEEMAQLQTIALLKSEGKAAGPGFWCYLNNTTVDSTTVIPYRMYAYASFLLTYDPNYSVFEESFSTPSTFHVFPETGFVPLDPVSQPSQISDLKTSSGAYVRQYNSCYYRGTPVGACEIAVNPQSTSVSIPNTYAHSMAISGAGVLDGGSVTFNGGPVTTLAPQTAVILIGQTATPAPSPTPVTATATAAPTSTISTSTGTTVTGQIRWISTSATKFQLLLANGSTTYVYLTNSLTSAQIGEYMTATGTGTNPLYATTATLSTSAPAPSPTPTAAAPTAAPLSLTATPAPAAYSVTGKILWVSSSATKLQLQQSNGTSIYVYYTNSTQLNYSGTPKPGEYAKATGSQTSPVYATAVWISNTAF